VSPISGFDLRNATEDIAKMLEHLTEAVEGIAEMLADPAELVSRPVGPSAEQWARGIAVLASATDAAFSPELNAAFILTGNWSEED
jgi:hypothetical protein